MKIKLFIVSLFVATGLFAAGTQTVSYVLKSAQDHENVILEGTFIAQVDDDEFIFQDTTGKIKVDVSRKHTDIQPAVYGLHRLDGARVKIKAIVDKEMFERTELDVIRIKVLKLAPDDFAGTDNFSGSTANSQTMDEDF